MDPVLHCNHLNGEEEAGHFAFLWCMACVMSVLVCFFFLLVIGKLRGLSKNSIDKDCNSTSFNTMDSASSRIL